MRSSCAMRAEEAEHEGAVNPKKENAPDAET